MFHVFELKKYLQFVSIQKDTQTYKLTKHDAISQFESYL